LTLFSICDIFFYSFKGSSICPLHKCSISMKFKSHLKKLWHCSKKLAKTIFLIQQWNFCNIILPHPLAVSKFCINQILHKVFSHSITKCLKLRKSWNTSTPIARNPSYLFSRRGFFLILFFLCFIFKNLSTWPLSNPIRSICEYINDKHTKRFSLQWKLP